jgi:DNA-binding response OmpR family regulator
VGDLLLRPDEGVMACGEERITLPPAEMQLMLTLVRGAGQVVRRGVLEAAAWGLSDAVTPNALDVALHRLRRKLGAIGSRQRIVNVRTQGYALRETPLAE